jgi:Peptidase family S41
MNRITTTTTIFVVLLSIASANAGDFATCFYRAKQFTFLSNAQECIESVPLDMDAALAVISTIKSTFPLYVFYDIARDSPSPEYSTHVNIPRQIERLETKLANGDYRTEISFQSDLAALFLSLDDGHTTYDLPSCFMQFTAELPFYLVAHGGDSRNQSISIAAIKEDVLAALHEFFDVNVDAIRSLVGATVLTIDGEPALDVLARWADVGTGTSRDIGCRVNLAVSRFALSENVTQVLAGSFGTRSLRHPWPSARNSVVQFVTSQDPANEFGLNWVVSVAQEFTGVDNFRSACAQKPSASLLAAERRQQQRWRPLESRVPRAPAPFASLASQAAAAGAKPLLLNSAASFFQVGNRTGVMAIPGFGSVKSFANVMYDGFALFAKSGLDQLIIDLSNNGGGQLDSGYALIDYLFPSDVRNKGLYGLNDMIHSPLANELAITASGKPSVGTYWSPSSWQNPASGEPFASFDEWWLPGETYERGGVINNYSVKFVDNFTSSLDALKPPPRSERFKPAAIHVLTNGFCGSTCAVFARHLQEYDSVATVVVGGLRTHPMGATTTPGGEVTDLGSVQQQIAALGLSSSPLAPQPFPNTASMRFTVREIYPWAPGAPNLPLEFYFEKATHRLFYTPASAQSPMLVWQQVLPLF